MFVESRSLIWGLDLHQTMDNHGAERTMFFSSRVSESISHLPDKALYRRIHLLKRSLQYPLTLASKQAYFGRNQRYKEIFVIPKGQVVLEPLTPWHGPQYKLWWQINGWMVKLIISWIKPGTDGRKSVPTSFYWTWLVVQPSMLLHPRPTSTPSSCLAFAKVKKTWITEYKLQLFKRTLHAYFDTRTWMWMNKCVDPLLLSMERMGEMVDEFMNKVI